MTTTTRFRRGGPASPRWMQVSALFALVALGLTLAACGSPSTPQSGAGRPQAGGSGLQLEQTTIKVGLTQAAVSTAIVRIAADRGYFSNEGLDVKLTNIDTAAAHIAAINGGSTDVDLATPDGAYSAIQGGAPLKVIANLGTANNYQLAISSGWAKKQGITASTPPIEVVQRLRGARVATSPAGGSLDIRLHDMFKVAGLADSDVQPVPLGSASAQLAGLEHGAVDAFLYVPPATTTAATRAGAFLLPISALASAEPAFNLAYNLCLSVKADSISRIPNSLTAFEVAVLRAQQWAIANPDAAFSEVAKDIPGTDRAAYDSVVASFGTDIVPTSAAQDAVVSLYNLGRPASAGEMKVSFASSADTQIAENAKKILSGHG